MQTLNEGSLQEAVRPGRALMPNATLCTPATLACSLRDSAALLIFFAAPSKRQRTNRIRCPGAPKACRRLSRTRMGRRLLFECLTTEHKLVRLGNACEQCEPLHPLRIEAVHIAWHRLL